MYVYIKYSLWHFKRALEIQKNELYGNKVEKIKDLYIYYNNISNFPFINPEYIYDIYSKIKSECREYNYVQFLGHLLAIPEELDTAILSDKAYAMGLLKC